VRPWIALLTVTVIPFSVILFCNVLIVRALFAVRRLRSEQSSVSAADKVDHVSLWSIIGVAGIKNWGG